MRICDLSKSDILTYLYKKNVLTAKEVQFHFANTPKYEVEKILITFLNKKNSQEFFLKRTYVLFRFSRAIVKKLTIKKII